MEGQKRFIPSYINYFFVLSNIVLTCFVLVTANFIVSPLLAAFIIAILLNPLYSKLVKVKVPRLISAALSVIVFISVVLILISYITRQLSNISADPSISTALFTKIINNTHEGLSRLLNINLSNPAVVLETSFNNFLKSVVGYLPNAFSGTASYLSMFILFFISLFFFLYYQQFLINFVFKLFGPKREAQLADTANQIEDAVKNYIVGLAIVMVIVAILNSVGLLILGIKHALFFGILGALLTIVPFIGITIGSLLPAFFALVTMDSLWYPILVVAVFGFVQFLEGNIITPIIIGSKENINPYVAILGLFVGGFLLGGIGIVLAIPLLGIIKIVCDDIDSLKPIGYVMGNPRKDPNSISKWLAKIFTKSS